MCRLHLLACTAVALVIGLGDAFGAGREGDLVVAIKSGDVSGAMSLIRHGGDINVPEADGTTALHWAVHRDNLELVEALLQAGASATSVNRYGVQPLSLACFNGNAAIVERLLASGADPNTTKPAGETVLMTAARSGSADVVRRLVSRGADVNRRDPERGQTALMWAAAENHAEVVQILLDHGGDIAARSRAGFTPLLYAARGGHLDAARALLLRGGDVNDTLPTGISALVLAVVNAKYQLATLLLEYGADPNADGAGWTALHQMAWTRRPHVGFNNPDPVPVDGVDGLELVRTLIDYGADPNARVKKELKDEPRTGLSGLNRTGATPFFLAAKDADVELMRALASRGADPLLTNEDGTTPLMVAAGIGIFTPGEDPGTNEEALEAVKLALELGGRVTDADRRGETALHGAAIRGANALVKFLVSQGARLDAKNSRGWTPLTIAEGVMLGGTFKRQPETATLLRELMGQVSSGA
ncbi:MAG: ankyrin repeat domain-containing protein, partial [Vicinamibacterales bacterium]